MKTRNANDIRRYLADARRLLREIETRGIDAVPTNWLLERYNEYDAIDFLEELISKYEQELKETTRHGEQLAFAF